MMQLGKRSTGRGQEIQIGADRNHDCVTGSQRKDITRVWRVPEVSQNTHFWTRKEDLVATQKPSMAWEVDQVEMEAVVSSRLSTSPQSSRKKCIHSPVTPISTKDVANVQHK